MNRRELLLGTLLAPLIKPVASMMPKYPAGSRIGFPNALQTEQTFAVWEEESFDYSGTPASCRQDAQRKLNEWWSKKLDETILNCVA